MEKLKKIISIADLPQVRVLGRTTGKDVINLFWTGSGIEFLYTGSELWLEVNADYDTMEPWLAVELNGAQISRFPETKDEAMNKLNAGKYYAVIVVGEDFSRSLYDFLDNGLNPPTVTYYENSKKNAVSSIIHTEQSVLGSQMPFQFLALVCSAVRER